MNNNNNITHLDNKNNSQLLEKNSIVKRMDELIQNYLNKTFFLPTCIGFFGISGNIGERRAHRLRYLLEHASEDGLSVLLMALKDTTSHKLKNFIMKDPQINSFLKLHCKKTSSQTIAAKKVLTYYLDVVNIEAKSKIGDQIETLISNFSFSETHAQKKLITNIQASIETAINLAFIKGQRRM